MQKKVYDHLLGHRIMLQKPLSFVNKQDAQNIMCKREVKSYLKNLTTAQKLLYKASDTKVDIKEIQDEDDEDQIWQKIDKNISKSLPFIEDTIDRWNGRTQMLGQNKKQKTILQQIQETMADKEQLDKLLENSQQVSVDHYTDNAFYQQLLSDYLKQNDTYNNEEEQVEEDTGAGTNQEYLFGADLSLTQKYLARREKLKQLSSQNKKEIDRKATKGRKIRYTVHDKL